MKQTQLKNIFSPKNQGKESRFPKLTPIYERLILGTFL
jgi:hypothetical protein